ESIPDDVDLAHELVVEAETEISVRELVEGFEASLTGGAYHGTDLPDLRVQASNGCWVGYVDVKGRLLATREKDLVSTAEGRGDGFADGAGGTDEEDAHGRNLSRVRFVNGIQL